MVTPDWLKACKKQGELVQPKIFIEALPTRVKELTSNSKSNGGVLKLAAAWVRQPEQPSLPFQNMFVYLCGNFELSRDEATYLLTNGAATMLYTHLATSNQLNYLSKAELDERSISTVVIVCGKSRVTLEKSLEGDIKTAVQDTVPPVNVMLVNESWIVESIACARPLSSNLFPPSSKKDVWKLCMSGN